MSVHVSIHADSRGLFKAGEKEGKTVQLNANLLVWCPCGRLGDHSELVKVYRPLAVPVRATDFRRSECPLTARKKSESLAHNPHAMRHPA